MGSINCNCISSRSETGPILDENLRNDHRKAFFSPTAGDFDTFSTSDCRPIDIHVSISLKIFLSRKHIRNLSALLTLEKKLETTLSEEVRNQYIGVGPYFKHLLDSNAEVVKLRNGSIYFGQSTESDQFQGEGCLLSPEGILSEGHWSKGLLTGLGRMIYQNGDYYEVLST